MRAMRCVAMSLLLAITGSSGSAVGREAAAEPATPSSVADPQLGTRLASLPKSSPWPDDWFMPREVVSGAPGAVLSLPQTTRRDIDAVALEQASNYSASHDGRALLVWRDGVLQHAWLAPGFDPSARFNSYHMHWLPLVLLTGVAVGEGRIKSVEDRVQDYIPEWRDDPRGSIRIVDLLQMSAGLQLYKDSTDPAKLATRLFFGGNRQQAILDWPTEFSRGTVFEYNYAVPELLGLILERATHRRYANYLADSLWRPLGNRDAEVWLDRPNGLAYHNAALFASALDWLNLGVLLADRGRFAGRQIVPAAWLRQLATPSAVNPNFGFLWLGEPYLRERRLSPRVNYFSLVGERFARPDVLLVDGYVHRLYAVPSEKLVVLHVGAPGRMNDTRRERWDDAALLNPILEGLRPMRGEVR